MDFCSSGLVWDGQTLFDLQPMAGSHARIQPQPTTTSLPWDHLIATCISRLPASHPPSATILQLETLLSLPLAHERRHNPTTAVVIPPLISRSPPAVGAAWAHRHDEDVWRRALPQPSRQAPREALQGAAQ
jgi:hypothetical protein